MMMEPLQSWMRGLDDEQDQHGRKKAPERLALHLILRSVLRFLLLFKLRNIDEGSSGWMMAWER